MHRKSFLILATAAALSACAVPPQLGAPPVLRVGAAGDIGQSLAGQARRDWPADNWWQAWGDPQLNMLVAEALAGNPDMAAAEARVAAADAAARQSRAGLRPSLTGNASLGGTQLSRNQGFPPQFVPAGVRESGLVNLQAGWNFDLWGQGRAQLRAVRREADAVAVERAQTRLLLAASVAAAYADFAAALDREAAARDALAIRLQTLDISAKRVSAGLDNDGARAQAASRLALAEADLAAAGQTVLTARHRIALLLGAGPDRGLTLKAPAITPLPPGVPADVGISLIARRPDIIAARLRAEAAGVRETAARRAFLPNLSVNATLGYQSLGFAKLLESNSVYAQFGPALSLPLLDGGRRAADLSGARASRVGAAAAHDATLLRALNEVADAASAVTALGTQQAAVTTALAEALRAQDVATLRYQAGLSNQLAVLIADDAVVAARRTVADIGALRLSADVALVRALGGGYRVQSGEQGAR
ncbi:MAG: efflux transporter outer membrane subunit [Sphingomonadales bacterium]